ncbi:MAG: MFS transporter [Eubacteriales bacterium]
MIVTVLLIIIYLSFISLGLPDSLLGVSWPIMHIELGVSADAAGIVSMIAVGATILSSLLSGKIVKWLGTGKVVFISCLMTGLSLLGMSFAPSFFWLLPIAIPLGFGGGSVDAALNNYVASNYKAHHMNWLHSFWGVGATVGPVIMSGMLLTSASWRGGYRVVSIIQLSLAIILFASLPLWKKAKTMHGGEEIPHDNIEDKGKDNRPHKVKGLIFALLTFLLYCTIESSIGLWGSTYLVGIKNIDVTKAASWIGAYFGGITAGRFISGFISIKLNNRQMIRGGMAILIVGAILFAMPFRSSIIAVILVVIGLGLSPIFPGMIHETPARFGKEHSQTIIGFQMASAYVGIAFATPLIGVILERISLSLLPFILIGVAAAMIICSERLIKIYKLKNQEVKDEQR